MRKHYLPLSIFLVSAAFACTASAAGLSCKYDAGYAYDCLYGTYLAYHGDGVKCSETSAPECYWIDHTNFTFALWLKPYVLRTDDTGIIGDLLYEGTATWGAGIRSDGYENARLYAGADFDHYAEVEIQRMRWQFLVGTFDLNDNGGTSRLYHNGVLGDSVSNLGKGREFYQDFLVGIVDQTDYVTSLPAQYDEISVWDHALSAEDVAWLYKRHLTGNETGLLLYWAADGDNITNAIDRSGNGRHGTYQNAVKMKNLETFRFTANCRGCFNDTYPRCRPWDNETDDSEDEAVTGIEECGGLDSYYGEFIDDCNVDGTCANETYPILLGCYPESGRTCSSDNILRCYQYLMCQDCECSMNALDCAMELSCSIGDLPNVIPKGLSTCLSNCPNNKTACYKLTPDPSAAFFDMESCRDAGFLWCNKTCVLNEFYCLEMCGNGVIDPDEACDDGNTLDGDGCSSDCATKEPGWNCAEGVPCTTFCSDGITAGLEQCDDGNLEPGDGCAANCTLEAGFICNTTMVPTVCALIPVESSDPGGANITLAVVVSAVVGVIIIAAIAIAVVMLLATRRIMSTRHVSAKIALSQLFRGPSVSAGDFDESGSALVTPEEFPLDASPSILRFGLEEGERASLDALMQDTLTLHASGGRTKFKIFPPKSAKYDLVVFPESGAIASGNTTEITLQLTMYCTSNLDLRLPVQTEIGTAKQHIFLTIHVETRLTTKLDPDEIELAGEPIGDGSYGRVYRGVYRTQDVAVKVLKVQDISRQMRDEFMREVRIMEELRSPFIVNFIGAVPFPGKLCLVTEFIPNGSLAHVLKHSNLTYGFKVRAALDCSRGMAYLHASKVMHRDLKPDNLLVASMDEKALVVCKLTDFGTTREVGEAATRGYTKGVGTPIYMAPEVLDSKSGAYSMPADVYSFGIMLFELITEKEPYSDDPRFEQCWNIARFVTAGDRLAIPESSPEEFTKLIRACWAHDPAERPTFAKAAAQLEEIFDRIHPEMRAHTAAAGTSASALSVSVSAKVAST